MNEEPKITSEVKTKNPGRVAAGKRLAVISKEAKERKKQERLSQENSKKEDSSSSGYVVVLAALTGAAVYFQKYRKTEKPVKERKTTKEPKPKPQKRTISMAERRLINKENE